MRGVRIHDVLHVILGLGVTPIEEYAVASFTIAQHRSAFHMVLIASGYIHNTFKEPENIAKFLETTYRFYELGKKSEFVTGFRFEDHFATPLKQVRESLKIGIE